MVLKPPRNAAQAPPCRARLFPTLPSTPFISAYLNPRKLPPDIDEQWVLSSSMYQIDASNIGCNEICVAVKAIIPIYCLDRPDAAIQIILVSTQRHFQFALD